MISQNVKLKESLKNVLGASFWRRVGVQNLRIKPFFNARGMTLVELLVSMGIFAVVMALTVGFFIAMQRMQMIYRDQANVQQEGRIVSEIFSRYAREAVAVHINDENNDGSICSDNDAAAVEYAGPFKDYIAMRMKPSDSFALVFACRYDATNPDLSNNDFNPRYLTMGTITDVDLTTITPDDMYVLPYISSGQIKIRNFQITHNNPPTYPKTLKYNIEVEQFKYDYSAFNVVGEGERIIFPGYLVMRNEL